MDGQAEIHSFQVWRLPIFLSRSVCFCDSNEPMEWPTITAEEALTRLKEGACAVDVRSEGEFADGHIPGIHNVAILNNEHRHLVGLKYKNDGQNAAIELGLELVSPLREGLLSSWRGALLHEREDMRLVLCWRGGLRSKMTCEWLGAAGFSGVRVVGGYKKIRARLLAALEKPVQLLVVGGLTGCGKTELLRELPRASVLDLELYANHRGSSFGLDLDDVQPQQQTFENALAMAVLAGYPVMAVEAESRLIGKCVIPAPMKAAMDERPLVVLEAPMEERVQRVFAEYVQEPVRRAGAERVFEHLSAALKRVERRLGGLRYQEIQKLLTGAFLHRDVKLEKHAAWIADLLRFYYDPQYEFSLKTKARPVAFRGGYEEVRAYLKDQL